MPDAKGLNMKGTKCLAAILLGIIGVWAFSAAQGAPVATDGKTFSWNNKQGEYLDLLFNGQKVMRYMYAYDTSTPQRLFETYKPFHHVFDAQGAKLLTNGPDGESPYIQDKILYPHHRGIFIGWNKIGFEGQVYDLWHMKEVAQVHQKFLKLATGPTAAELKTLIHWNDKKGEPIIVEERQVTAIRQSSPAIIVIDYETALKAVRGEVYLDGDPEHAGFQYRAHNGVAAGEKQVKAQYLFHRDGIDAQKDRDLPWVVMDYGLNGRRYNVQYMNHPGNPKPAIYSAYRDYGRFGSFFRYRIKSGETLKLRYRIRIGEGRMPGREEAANRYSAFVNEPKVEP